MKTNYHTHTIWCDGRNTAEEVIVSAIEKKFDIIGFSSHSTYPDDNACTVPSSLLSKYFEGIRALSNKYAEQIKVLCVRSNISMAELARRIGLSPQSFSAKMKRESFTIAELDVIADAVGASFVRKFVLYNGDEI
jgi:lambda repressor-like predicted transcriptional regulator